MSTIPNQNKEARPPKTVLTYGTFDMFHIGHLNLLERLAALGNRLIVGVSTDEFNERKGKSAFVAYDERARIVRAIRGVDLVIPERSWDQKSDDILEHDVSIFAMGDDWIGAFDFLSELCQVQYLPRTVGVSSSAMRERVGELLSSAETPLTTTQ